MLDWSSVEEVLSDYHYGVWACFFIRTGYLRRLGTLNAEIVNNILDLKTVYKEEGL